MCRTIARIGYVERCRIYNESLKEEDRIRAEAYLEGVADAYRDGDGGREHLFDFCVAADSVAQLHGNDNTCWGLRVDRAPQT